MPKCKCKQASLFIFVLQGVLPTSMDQKSSGRHWKEVLSEQGNVRFNQILSEVRQTHLSLSTTALKAAVCSSFRENTPASLFNTVVFHIRGSHHGCVREGTIGKQLCFAQAGWKICLKGRSGLPVASARVNKTLSLQICLYPRLGTQCT